MKLLVNPILDPQTIVRGQWNREPAQKLYIQRVWKYLKGRRELPNLRIDRPPPNSKLMPTIGDLEEFNRQFPPEGEMDAISVDIENAGQHIICIGFTAFHSGGNIGSSVCVRFRKRGGGLWHKHRELVQVVTWLFDILRMDSISKVFHNGVTYDVPILQELGFQVEGRLIDTLNLQHCVYPEDKKGLQYCSTLYNWSPAWKTLVEEEDEAEGKG